MFESALRLGYTAFKIHARHPYRTRQTSIPKAHIQAYRDIRREHRKLPVFVQANKQINFASPLREDYEFALRELATDYLHGALLEPTGVIVQAGYHKHSGERKAIYQTTKLLEELIMKEIGLLGICTIILETSSGEGTAIGHNFAQLKHIIDGLSAGYLVEICFDVTNVFAAGYDIATADGLESTLDEFDRLLDIDRIACINFSDADYPLGSRKRFRTPLGEGEIGIEGLARIINHPALATKPFILEAMVDKDHIGHHPDYEVALGLMKDLSSLEQPRKHKRLLSHHRLNHINQEREQQLYRKLGVGKEEGEEPSLWI